MDKVLYVYRSHCGFDDYITEHELSKEQLYCRECNASDTLLFRGTATFIISRLKFNITIAKRALQKAKEEGEKTDELINKELKVINAINDCVTMTRLLDEYLDKENEDELN